MKIKKYDKSSIFFYIGPYEARLSWDGIGRFSNGNRFFSGWHKTKKVTCPACKGLGACYSCLYCGNTGYVKEYVT